MKLWNVFSKLCFCGRKDASCLETVGACSVVTMFSGSETATSWGTRGFHRAVAANPFRSSLVWSDWSAPVNTGRCFPSASFKRSKRTAFRPCVDYPRFPSSSFDSDTLIFLVNLLVCQQSFHHTLVSSAHQMQPIHLKLPGGLHHPLPLSLR